MKSFEEAIGRNAAASAALCMSMGAVLEHCEKAVKQQGKKSVWKNCTVTLQNLSERILRFSHCSRRRF